MVAFMDNPRRLQQSLFHPAAVLLCQVMQRELQMQQGWCALHRSANVKGDVSTMKTIDLFIDILIGWQLS